jgi:antitoxin VapB
MAGIGALALVAPVSREAGGGAQFRRNSSASQKRTPLVSAKDVAFPEGVKEVAVLRDGARRVIVPANASWDDFFAEPGFPMPDREQPSMQERDRL